MIQKHLFPWKNLFRVLALGSGGAAAGYLFLLGFASFWMGLKARGAPGWVMPIAAGVSLFLATLLLFIKAARRVVAKMRPKGPSAIWEGKPYQ